MSSVGHLFFDEPIDEPARFDELLLMSFDMLRRQQGATNKSSTLVFTCRR